MQTFEERKNNYISHLINEYALSEKIGINKILSLEGYEFCAIKDYKVEYKLKADSKEELVIRATLGKHVILITVIFFILIASIKLRDSWYLNLLLFVGMALVLSCLFYIKIGKAVVVINFRSIFIKGNTQIQWANVVMTCFKTYYSDGELQVYSMIIHYYDEGADTFRQTEIPLTGLSTNPEEIAFYVKKFSK